MENFDYKNLVNNIIKFNEKFNEFEDKVASIMESKVDDKFDTLENVKLLLVCQKYINNMIDNLKSE
jgi:hypothetical protein|uniref:Uncharacterized protein n=1 Tax=viral metagenome TaxID=1070528 RepID=A0A6C0IM81_9ZZZZ